MMRLLSSEIHKIGIVDTKVEASTGHVYAGSIGCEGAELKLAGDHDLGICFVHNDLLHLLKSDVATIDALNVGSVWTFQPDITTRWNHVDCEILSVEGKKTVIVFQMIGGVNRKGEDHIEVVAIMPSIEGHRKVFAVGDEVEGSVASIEVKHLFVDVRAKGVITHFGIDGQPRKVWVVDVLRFLEV